MVPILGGSCGSRFSCAMPNRRPFLSGPTNVVTTTSPMAAPSTAQMTRPYSYRFMPPGPGGSGKYFSPIADCIVDDGLAARLPSWQAVPTTKDRMAGGDSSIRWLGITPNAPWTPNWTKKALAATAGVDTNVQGYSSAPASTHDAVIISCRPNISDRLPTQMDPWAYHVAESGHEHHHVDEGKPVVPQGVRRLLKEAGRGGPTCKLALAKGARLGQAEPPGDEQNRRAGAEPEQWPPAVTGRVDERPRKGGGEEVAQGVAAREEARNDASGLIGTVLEGRGDGVSVYCAHGDAKQGPGCQELAVLAAEAVPSWRTMKRMLLTKGHLRPQRSDQTPKMTEPTGRSMRTTVMPHVISELVLSNSLASGVSTRLTVKKLKASAIQPHQAHWG